MGIPVNCPNGHHFSVKDKYAGKKGICPYCEGQVVVRVPDALTSPEMQKAYNQAYREERGGRPPSNSDSSVFDSGTEDKGASASGSSLLGLVVFPDRCVAAQHPPVIQCRDDVLEAATRVALGQKLSFTSHAEAQGGSVGIVVCRAEGEAVAAKPFAAQGMREVAGVGPRL